MKFTVEQKHLIGRVFVAVSNALHNGRGWGLPPDAFSDWLAKTILLLMDTTKFESLIFLSKIILLS